jgi:hypothetical protein
MSITLEEILGAIEDEAVPAFRRAVEDLSRKWPELHWTLQIRGNDALKSWIISGFKHASPLDDDEVAASLTLQIDGGPRISTDIWLGSSTLGQGQALIPEHAKEVRSFLSGFAQAIPRELDIAAERLLTMIAAPR